jgi:hypothetical protein
MTSGAKVVDIVACLLQEVTDDCATPADVRDVLWLCAHLPARTLSSSTAAGDSEKADAGQTTGDSQADMASLGVDAAGQIDLSPPVVVPNLLPDRPDRQPEGSVPPASGAVLAISRSAWSDWSALQDPLGVGRALRSLQIRLPSARFLELDEVATAERRAQLGWWEPVLRRKRVRWPDVAVVVDCAPATRPIWGAMIRSLLKVFERLGAFRELRTWRLHPPPAGAKDREPQVSPDAAGGVTGSRPATAAIMEPTGRRLVLVVTDGVSEHWRGPYLEQLHRWAKTNPVAVISLVPARLWPDSGLHTVPGDVRADHPLQPNQLWKHRHSGDPFGESIQTPVVPVADLNSRRLEWLAAALSTRSQWTTTALVARGEPPGAPKHGSLVPPLAHVGVQRFRAHAQPRVFDLLGYLSAAPLLQPLVGRMRQTVVPQARDEDLQEIALSGLVEPARPDEMGPADVMALRFQRRELRQELAVRLHPELAATIQWDLRAYAQETLAWDYELAEALLKEPDEPDLLRQSAAGAKHLPPGWSPVQASSPGEFEWMIAKRLDEADQMFGHLAERRIPHLAVVGEAAPRRAVEINQLAQRLATAGVLRSDQVRLITGADLLAAKDDPAVRARIAEVFADAGRAVVVDVPAWLRDRRQSSAQFAVDTLIRAMSEPRPGQLVVLSGRKGNVDALRDAYPDMAVLVPDDRIRPIAAAPFDNAYSILRGWLKREGPTIPARPPAKMWTTLVMRLSEAPEDLDRYEQARGLAHQIAANWRERTGGDPRRPVTPEDMLDTTGAGWIGARQQMR